MKLHELFEMTHNGYSYRDEEESDEDNKKILHYITPPGGKEEWLDHSPYERVDHDALRHYVNFHKAHGRFPTRIDINSNGPLHKSDLNDLMSK